MTNVGEVTAFTYTEGTKALKITGTDLPSKIEDIQTVMFSLAKCKVDPKTLSATNIDCTLEINPTCGEWLPTVTTQWGNVQLAKTGLTKRKIDCTITKIFPDSTLNLLGYDNVTISGTNFPHNLIESTVTVNYDNTEKTKCIP
jgi:hypothetical protein